MINLTMHQATNLKKGVTFLLNSKDDAEEKGPQEMVEQLEGLSSFLEIMINPANDRITIPERYERITYVVSKTFAQARKEQLCSDRFEKLLSNVPIEIAFGLGLITDTMLKEDACAEERDSYQEVYDFNEYIKQAIDEADGDSISIDTKYYNVVNTLLSLIGAVR